MSHLATKTAGSSRPLAVSLLLGLSGWGAGGFILMLMALLFHPNTTSQAAICGVLLLGAAWWLFTVDRDEAQAFVSQLALALSIAGQCLVLSAMAKDARGIGQIAMAALPLQITLALMMPNRLHRTLSTLFALIAWALTVRFVLFGEAEGWSREAAPYSTSLPAALAGWALAWGPVVAALWLALRKEAMWAGRSWAPALSAIVTGLIGSLAFATLASHPFESFAWLGRERPDLGNLALWPLLSAVAALGALAAAFELRRRGLMALCVVAALLHVSHFYYALGASLVLKSLLMLVMGGVCLVGAHVLRAKEPA